MADALNDDDYRALYGMLTSSDEGQRTQAIGLAGKMTPEEGQAFFNFQHAANAGKGELTRTDNTVGGIPPEMAATGIASVGAAMGGRGLTLAARGAAGAKAAVAQVAPVVKYERTKTALTAMGVPGPLATVAAVAISGYKHGGAGKAAAAETETAAARPAQPAQPAATTPSGPAVTTMGGQPAKVSGQMASQAPATPSGIPVVNSAAPSDIISGDIRLNPPKPTAPAMSPQQTLNELAIAARRAKTVITAAEEPALVEAVQKGLAPSDAVAELVKARAEGITSDAGRTFPTNKGGAKPQRAPTAWKGAGKLSDLADMLEAVRSYKSANP